MPSLHSTEKPQHPRGDIQPEQLLTKPGREFIRQEISRRFKRQLDPQQVEDVVQEAWVKAKNQLHALEDRSKFITWLRRIAINAALDYLRDIVSPQKRGGGAKKEIDIHNPLLRIPGVEGDQITWEAKEELRRRFSTLTEKEQAVYRLSAEDLTLEEMAERLGWPLGTVKSRLHRASKKMRGGG